MSSKCADSPGFNAGRGLKQRLEVVADGRNTDSPGFNAGRGLKRFNGVSSNRAIRIRPALMPGVD